jgi:hypothetical protein
MSPTVKKTTTKKSVKKAAKKSSAVPRIRQNVGARNPYALADAVLGERQNWQRMAATRKKTILEEALRRPYEELFDPVYGSPLYTLDLIGEIRGERVRTMAGNPCTSSVSQWAAIPGGTYFKDPKADRPYMQDPVQGCGNDCYVLASCSAIAWVSPQLIPAQAGPAYGYTFWNIRNDNVNRAVNTNAQLALDSTGKPVYGHSQDPLEIWLSLVEKAYGIAKGLTGADIGQPDLATDSGGNPVTALTHMAKGVDALYSSTSIATAGKTWAQMMTAIGANKFDPANACTVAFSKTKFPMVAYTYKTAPAGVSYQADTIAANHSYAVLGLYRTNNKCYIVLRNPYGPVAGDPALANSLATGTWTIQSSKYYGRGGAQYARIAADNYSVNLADNDGTFALDTAIFMTHFEGLGYLN